MKMERENAKARVEMGETMNASQDVLIRHELGVDKKEKGKKKTLPN